LNRNIKYTKPTADHYKSVVSVFNTILYRG